MTLTPINLCGALLLLTACVPPASASAVQTQQPGLIRSVVLDAPGNEPALINALTNLRGRPLTLELRSATMLRLRTVVDTLGWTGAGITLPATLDGNGRWLVSISGVPPTPANDELTARTRGKPIAADSNADHASPTLAAWYQNENAQVLIVLGTHTLYAKLGGGIERFPVAVGRRSNPTPLGQYQVQNIAHKPTWFPTQRMRAVALQRGRELPKRVPPGPGNPLGDWFVALGQSIGIHGNNSPWSIGRSASMSSAALSPRSASERPVRKLGASGGGPGLGAGASSGSMRASTPAPLRTQR